MGACGLMQQLSVCRHHGNPATRPLTRLGEAARRQERQGLPIRGEPRLRQPLEVQQLIEGDH